jgi:ribosomal protein L37E
MVARRRGTTARRPTPARIRREGKHAGFAASRRTRNPRWRKRKKHGDAVGHTSTRGTTLDSSYGIVVMMIEHW